MSERKAREERREQRLRDEGAVASRERRRRLLQLASALAFLVIIGVAVAIVVSLNQGGGGDTNLEGVGTVRSELEGIPQNAMVLGDPGAKVTLIEFGDLQCPVCKGYSEGIVPEVIDSKVRSGQAKIEFRNFTIIGKESAPAGASAVAAGKQGRAWNFIELFYRNQGQEDSGYVTDAFLNAIAKGAGVPDLARWKRERQENPALTVVHRTTAEAESLGFTGTPSFAVEGPRTNGLKTLGTPGSAGALEEAIDQAG
jgi:protein-disulfide isomerase